MAVFLAGCSKEDKRVYIESVTIPRTATIEEGQTQKLSATVLPEGITEKYTILWKSSDNTVASVDGNGNIKAVKAGTAKVIAYEQTKQNIKSECEVTVIAKPVEIQTIIFKNAPSEMTEGETFILDWEIAPMNINQPYELVLSTSDKNIATVDITTKKLTAIKKGETMISISAKSRPQVKSEFRLSVKKSDVYNGNAVLGDNINAEELSTYKVVNGNLTVNNLNNLRALNNNLQEISGNLTINVMYSSDIQNLDGLYGLKRIGGKLIIKGGRGGVGGGLLPFLSFEGMNNLESFAGLEMDGIYLYRGFESLKNFKGKSITSIYLREVILGELYDTFKEFESIEAITEGIYIYDCNIGSFEGFENVTVLGDLEIGNSVVKSFKGLEKVTTLKKFRLVDSDGFTSFVGLNNLIHIEYFSLSCLPSYMPGGGGQYYKMSRSFEKLQSFEGLEKLESIGEFYFSFSGAENINEDRTSMPFKSFISFKGLDNVRKMNSLQILIGHVYSKYIGTFGSFKSLEGFNSLREVSNLFRIKISGAVYEPQAFFILKSLDEFKNLEKIGGLFHLECSGSSFTNLGGFSKLVSVGEDMIISNNPQLNDINGLKNLTTLGGNMKITNNPKLNDFKVLKDLFSKNDNIIFTATGNGSNPTKYQIIND